ncbi:MAG: hypothetical protein NVSMB55_04190 [Mycobacteriales bacterium]
MGTVATCGDPLGPGVLLGWQGMKEEPHRAARPGQEPVMVVLGLVLLILGLLVASLHVLFVIGLILLLVGLVLNFVPVGGSRRRVF